MNNKMRMYIGPYLNKDGTNREYEFYPEALGKGWEPILSQLYDDLVALGWDRHLYQYKEKFGGLRFYIGHGTTPIFERISCAEELSMRTCMECGKPGKRRGNGWILCLCDEHSNEELGIY